MKSKVLLIVLVLIIVALLIILGFKLFEKEPKDTLPMEAQQMVPQEIWKPGHSEEGKEIVRRHIRNVEAEFREMSGELTDERIERIYAFFQDRGFMTKHNGTPAKGRAIYNYLDRERDNIDRIDFLLAYFTSEELTHILKLKKAEQKEEDVLHVVILGIQISYNYNGTLIDPPGGRDDYHIRDCTWGPGE